MTPYDYKHPDWENYIKVHDWKNYITEKIRGMWETFSDEQKQAIAENADEVANAEEWE